MSAFSGLIETNVPISHIAVYLSAHAICKLWFCGNSRLNYFLATEVQSFRLEYAHTERLISSLVWPKLISQFMRLHDLQVTLPEPLCHYAIVRGVDFSIISPTIRTLRLKFANSFFELLDANAALLGHEQSRPALVTPMKDRFYNMETIEISHGMRAIGPKLEKMIFSLPTALLRLCLPESALLYPLLVSSLPRTIQHLDCSITCDDVAQIQNLNFPPNLTLLNFKHDSDTTILARLPADITYLRIHLESSPLSSTEDVLLLPKKLTFLYTPVAEFHAKMSRNLPNTLIEAHLIGTVCSNPQNVEESGNPLAHLPRGLKVVTGLQMRRDGWGDPTAWMSQFHIREEETENFPAFLRIVPVDFTPWSLLTSTKTGPMITSCLEELAVPFPTPKTLLSALPPTLRFLRLNSAHTDVVPQLPKRLTSLQIDKVTFSMKFWNSLSPLTNLVKLVIDCKWNYETPSSSKLDTAPDPAEQLDLLEGPKLEFLKITRASPAPEFKFGSQRAWSSNMKTLTMHTLGADSGTTPQIFSALLSSLPRSLTTLDLIDKTTKLRVPAETLVHLPRTLTELSIGSIEISDKTKLAALPPLLTKLRFPDAPITMLKVEDLVQWLPPHLTELLMPRSDACEIPDNIDFAALLRQLPFLRSQNVVIPPATNYSAVITHQPNDLERHGKTYSVSYDAS